MKPDIQVQNCLAKPGVWNMKQQVKLLTVNTSLQMVVACHTFGTQFQNLFTRRGLLAVSGH